MPNNRRTIFIWCVAAIALMSAIGIISMQDSVKSHVFFGFCSMAIGIIAMLTLHHLNSNSKDAYTFALMVAAAVTWISVYMHILSDMGLLNFMYFSAQSDIQILHVTRIAQGFTIFAFLILQKKPAKVWLMLPLSFVFLILCYSLIYYGAFPPLLNEALAPSFFAISMSIAASSAIALLLALMFRRSILRPYIASFTIGGLLLIAGHILSVLSLTDAQEHLHTLEAMAFMLAYLAFYIGFTVPAVKVNLELGFTPFSANKNPLLNVLAHPSLITGQNLEIVTANREAEKWVGKNRIAMVGLTIGELLSYDARYFEDMASEANLTLTEVRRPPQEIMGRHVSFSVYPVVNQSNKVSRLTFVAWDVTGEVVAEANLAIREQTYKSLFRHVNTGFLLFALVDGSSGKEIEVIEANPAFERNTGEKASLLVGTKLREASKFLNAGWYDMILRAALESRSIMIDGYSAGSRRWLSISTFPVTQSSHGMVITDQTALRNFQREISASEQKYRSLVESMPMLVLSMDMNNSVSYINDPMRDALGIGSVEDYLAKPLDEVADKAHVELFIRLQSTLSKQRSIISEEAEVSVGSRRRWQRWNMKMIVDGDDIIGYICLGQDTTEQKEAEIRISMSEERFRTLFMDNYLPMLIVDSDNYEILMANKASQVFYGLSEAGLQGMTLASFSPEKNGESVRSMAEATKRSGFSSMYSKQIAANGKLKDVDIFASTLSLAERTVLSFTINDISDRRMMEEKLEKEKTYLDNLFENNPDAVAVIDSDLRLTRANIAFRKLFGFNGEDITSLKLSELIGNPQTAAEIDENLKRSIQGDKLDFTARRQRVDGSSFPVRVICIPMVLSDGSINVYAIYHDLSALAESQQMLSLANEVVKESPAILFKWANQTDWPVEFVSSNISRWGYSPDDLLGRKMRFSDLVHADDLPRVTEEVAHYLESGIDEYSQEYRLKMANGNYLWVEDHTRIVRSPAGHIEAIQGVLVDNTEKKVAELERLKTHQELRLAWERSLDVLSSVTEFKDPYTAGHQRGVAEIAEAIARQMGLPDSIVEAVHKSSLVHDIGKLHLPADILNRPRALTPLEYKLVKTHSQSGRDILSHIKLPWPLADIVLQHHERIDGSGYPKGLMGDEILLEARIIAVADIVDAMTSHRPYRPAFLLSEALREIQRLRGHMLDADVVDACIAAYQMRGITPDGMADSSQLS